MVISISFTLDMNTTHHHHIHVPEWMKRIWDNPPDPVVYFFPRVAVWDMRTLDTKLSVIGTTFLCAMIIFTLSYVASYFTVSTFRLRLRTKEKVFWCLAFVRAIFGFIASFFGAWYLAFDDTLHRDVVNGHSQSSFLAVYIGVGFFIFECIMLFGFNIIFRSFDPLLALHHALSLIGFSVCSHYGNTHFFAVVGMLLEMTTPFSCFCWMLLKANKADLFVWKFNQLVMVHLFHCRTTLEGFFFYKSYYQWSNIYDNMPLALKILLYTQLSLQFFVLTPYWTYKKMAQLYNPIDWNFPDSFLRRLSRTLSSVSNSSSNLNSPAGDITENGERIANGRLPMILEVDENVEQGTPITMKPVATANEHTENGSGTRKRKNKKKK